MRGTHDLIPPTSAKFLRITEIAREIASRYNFHDFATPIFEFTEVFSRSLGEATDIVSKEMYTFPDRGGESLTLRPELTAGICRAFISGGLAQHLPIRAFSWGPAFRYERPQKGRMRQFHQIDCELLGIAEPEADIEILMLGRAILKALGVLPKTKLELNTLGDSQSRLEYREKLVAYLSRYKNELSEESLKRLEVNPMRILDSKDEGDRKIVADAPKLSECLNAESAKFFARVQQGLTDLGVEYEINPTLVRGLDYYCHTAFEFTTTMLGAQNAVLAGGRYDKLIEQMGGSPTPAIGFASGVERLIELSEIETSPRMLTAVLPQGEEQITEALSTAEYLRGEGFAAEVIYSGNMGKKFKKADKLGAAYAVIIGEAEVLSSSVTLKNLTSGEQREKVSRNSLPELMA